MNPAAGSAGSASESKEQRPSQVDASTRKPGRWLRRLGILAGAAIILLGALWWGIHHVRWLGPALADGARSVFGPAFVARLEDFAYGMQDRYDRWRHGNDPPRAYWTTPSAVPLPAPASSGEPGKSSAGFPPARFAPPYPHVATRADGVWIPVRSFVDDRGHPFMYKTMVHPDKERPYAVLAVIAIDIQKTELHAVPGTIEPRDPSVPPGDRPGTIPKEDWPRLVAAFNGGFQSIHGHYAMMAGGHRLGKPQPGACTVGIYRDGTIRIRTWEVLARTVDQMRAYRQTPHCLVERGKRHPDLDANAYATHWGAVVGGKTVIRRSALGVDKNGRILFFGLGDSMTARSLADGMRVAGAYDVAQLDVNHVFPRFVFFGMQVHYGKKRLAAIEPLCDGFSFSADDYIRQPMVRDFFYLTRRREHHEERKAGEQAE